MSERITYRVYPGSRVAIIFKDGIKYVEIEAFPGMDIDQVVKNSYPSAIRVNDSEAIHVADEFRQAT